MRPFLCRGGLLLGLLLYGPVATALTITGIAGIGSSVQVGATVFVEWEDGTGVVSALLVGAGLEADRNSIWQNQGTNHSPMSRFTRIANGLPKADIVSPYFWIPTEPLAGKSFYLQFSDSSNDVPFNTSTFEVISKVSIALSTVWTQWRFPISPIS